MQSNTGGGNPFFGVASLAALAVVIIGLVPLTLSAQRTTRLVFVRATDAAGAPVLNLARADLRVTENGVPREVTRVSRGNAPLRIVLLVDSSTSMDPMMSTFRDALNAFVDTMPHGSSPTTRRWPTPSRWSSSATPGRRSQSSTSS